MNLFQSQIEDAATLARSTRKVLGNTIGTGKTRTVLAAFNELRAKNLADILVVVGPASVVYAEEGWEREANQLDINNVLSLDVLPAKRDAILNGKSSTSIVVLSYNCLTYNLNKILRFLNNNNLRWCLAGDESHNLTNPKAKRSKNFRALAQRAVCTWSISGSAVEHPNDLYGLDFSLGLDSFSSYDSFVKNFTVYTSTYLKVRKYGKVITIENKKVEKFNKEGWRLCEEWCKKYLLRRKPDESKLPIQLPSVYRYVELSKEEKKLYSELKDKLTILTDL